ncbi:MAG: hypothetical protein WC998_06330 [Candidatus Paceibacterota bacterium]
MESINARSLQGARLKSCCLIASTTSICRSARTLALAARNASTIGRAWDNSPGTGSGSGLLSLALSMLGVVAISDDIVAVEQILLSG